MTWNMSHLCPTKDMYQYGQTPTGLNITVATAPASLWNENNGLLVYKPKYVIYQGYKMV